MKLKIMTFNTQHCKNYKTKKIDYKSIIELINKHNPDIIGLNEIYGSIIFSQSFNQAKKIAKKMGYYYYFGKSTRLFAFPYGNAILSKYPIKSTEIIKIPFPETRSGNKYYEKRSIIKSNIIIDNKNIEFFITHLGLNTDEQINGINVLNKVSKNKLSIIMGDFNINYNNEILKIISSNYSNHLIKTKKVLYTFPSYKPKHMIDYIFTTKDIKTISYITDKNIISDHLPIISEIEI